MSAIASSVSILLCTFERTADLLATLDSLRRVRVPEDLDAELIVVDSSRNDETRRALASLEGSFPRLPLRVLHEPRRGKAHALNTGIAAARGDILLFTDDDVRLPPDWIEAMTRPLLTGAADAVAGGIHLAPDLRRPWMASWHRGWMASTEIHRAEAPDVLTGANMSIARRVLEKVPTFDTDLGAGTDLGASDESLFSMQLRAAGFRIAGVFEPSVEHHFDPSRLTRQCFLDRARIEGRSAAYITHHWRHQAISLPRLRWLAHWLRLHAKRWFLPRWKPAEGAPVWELIHLVIIHHMRQYLRERRRPRLYSKYGLVKQGSREPLAA